MRLLEHGNMLAKSQTSESNTMKEALKRMALVAQEGAEAALTSAFLNQLGWQVKVVSTWREAQRCLRECHYDVMVTDYHLAGGDGFQLISKWREQEIRLRVLFLAEAPIQSCVPIEGFGFCGLLMKPFSKTELKAGLTRVLRLKGKVERSSATASSRFW